MKPQTFNALFAVFIVAGIGAAALVLTSIYLTLGGAQADPMVLCLGMAAGVLLLAGLGRAAFRSGYGLMDQVLDPKQDQPRS